MLQRVPLIKVLFIAVIAIVLFDDHSGRAQTQSGPGSHSFLLHLSTKVNTTDLQIRYFITGPFGGYGSFVRPRPNVRDYVIETSHENMPAETLKIVIYCPGYGIELLNIPTLSAVSARKASVELKPLPSVRLSGKIVTPEGRSGKEFKTEVTYQAYWVHEFFKIADGMVTAFKVASIDVTQDGSFSVAIPDFAHDPAVTTFTEKGALILTTRDAKMNDMSYTLESADHPGKDARVEIAPKYDHLLLYAKPNR